MKKDINKISFEGGFSIIEVVIVLGLLGIVSLGVMKLMESQMDSMRFAESRSAEYNLVNQIRFTLHSRDACEANFVGKEIDTSIDEIVSASNVTLLEVGSTYDNAIELTELYLEELDDLSSGGFGMARLRVSMSRLPDQRESPLRFIDVMVGTDSSGEITRCYSDLDQMIETAKQESCESIGGTFNSATSQCEDTDYLKLGEELPYPSQNCHSGTHSWLSFNKEYRVVINNDQVHIKLNQYSTPGGCPECQYTSYYDGTNWGTCSGGCHFSNCGP